MYGGPTLTKLGRYSVAEPFRPDRIHYHDGSELKTTDFEPPIPCLDQEDLESQGIDTSILVPGARKVDALGSCTANAGTASLSERYAAVHGKSALGDLGLSATDAVGDEKFAIVEYHEITDQTGDPAQEWPPQDCGSTGLYVCQEFEKQGYTSSYKTASGMTNLVSLLQSGTVIEGTPWFNSWFEPDAQGFIDGDGSFEALMEAIRSGLAGGHETCISAVEKLALTATGQVEPGQTVVRVRNSWSASFGLSGSFLLHLSTLDMLGSHVDFKQFVI